VTEHKVTFTKYVNGYMTPMEAAGRFYHDLVHHSQPPDDVTVRNVDTGDETQVAPDTLEELWRTRHVR
jgi:hypothetical protein